LTRLRDILATLNEIKANLATRTPSPEAEDEDLLMSLSACIVQLDALESAKEILRVSFSKP
jgi:hypothetical protein